MARILIGSGTRFAGESWSSILDQSSGQHRQFLRGTLTDGLILMMSDKHLRRDGVSSWPEGIIESLVEKYNPGCPEKSIVTRGDEAVYISTSMFAKHRYVRTCRVI